VSNVIPNLFDEEPEVIPGLFDDEPKVIPNLFDDVADNTATQDLQGAYQKVLDGLFLGFGDEVLASVQAGSDEFLDSFRATPGGLKFKAMSALGSSAIDLFQNEETINDYENYLQKARAVESRFERDNPILATGLEISGALGSIFVTGGAAGVGAASTRAGNVGRLAATSAAEVAAYEIGEGEGGFQARVEGIDPASVALGAAIGGIGGAFLRGVAETPQQKQIFDRATATKKDTIISESSAAATRGPLGLRREVVADPAASLVEKLKKTTDALGLRSKNWHAENVSEESARRMVDADGQAMRIMAETIQTLDNSSGKKGSLARLSDWFETTDAGDRAKKALADAGKTGKYGVVDDPAIRQANFNKAYNIIRYEAPTEMRRIFDSINGTLRTVKELDPSNKATGDYWPYSLVDGVEYVSSTSSYKSPVASALEYIEDVRVAHSIAKNYGVDVRKLQPMRSANDVRKYALQLEKQGLSESEITEKVTKQLRLIPKSNTEEVINAVYKLDNNLNEAQKANQRDILTTTFINGRKSANKGLDALRVVVTTSQLAKLSNTILNVSELGIAATNYGTINALKALPGSVRSMLLTDGDKIVDDFGNTLRAPDLGVVNQFLGEIKQKGSGFVDRWSDRLFSIAGVRKITRLGQEVTINAALNKAKSLAKKGRLSEFKSAKGLSAAEIKQIEDQLNKNNIRHPLVKDLIFRDLTDIAPVSRVSMPKAFNEHPDGRVFYSMLSFMIQQQNLLRENVGRNVVQGYKKGLNTKEGRAHFRKAGNYGLRYVVLTAGIAGLFDDGRKILRGEEGAEYDPVESTANQLVQLGTFGMVQPRAKQYGRDVFDPLNPPQLSIARDVGSLMAETAMGTAEMDDFARATQRWVPGVSTLDDFLRYMDGERLLID
jgi:hypothetical protein